MTDDRLEYELRALSASAFPEAPSLVDGVMAGITGRRSPRRRWLAAVAVAAALVAVALVLPAPREALARLLGIGGVAIEHVAEYDLPEVASTGEPLGREVEQDDVAGIVGFAPRLPNVAGLTNPVAYVRTDVAGGLVSLVYRNEGEGAGLVITQFPTAGEVAIKQLPEEAEFREVTLAGGRRAFWIEGTHSIAFFGADGTLREDSARLVGNTLVWQDGGLTFRIESGLALSEVLTIAASIGSDAE